MVDNNRQSGSGTAVAFTLLKGGVTKTSIAINTTQAVADRGDDVLLVDLDTNGNATYYLGYGERYENADLDIGDVILESGEATPGDVIIETEFGFDLLPSSSGLERVEREISQEMMPSATLSSGLVDPLLGDHYDYIFIDTPADRGQLLNNAAVASLNLILPVIPEEGVTNGLQNTIDRVIKPLRKKRDLSVMAIVPNRLSKRLDHQTADRELLEPLCRSDNLSEYLPDFAYLSPEEWDALDAGEISPLPKPGIREARAVSKAFRNDQTLAVFDPDNDQLQYFDQLAEIVEQGGVQRE
jgi:chromosome partitioning protein